MNNTGQPLIEVRKIQGFPLKRLWFLTVFVGQGYRGCYADNLQRRNFRFGGRIGLRKATLGQLFATIRRPAEASSNTVSLRELNPQYVIQEIKLPKYQAKAISLSTKLLNLIKNRIKSQNAHLHEGDIESG